MIVLAEGLVEIIDQNDLGGLDHVERDEHGHLRLSEVDIGDLLRREVTKGLKALGLSVTVVSKNVGYELRCADPIPYDIEYTRDLGYCAAQYLLDGGTAAMVTIQDGRFAPIPFKEMLDPVTGRASVRMVDTDSQSYHIARQYMIRLDDEDFKDQERLAAMRRSALSPDAFKQRFQSNAGKPNKERVRRDASIGRRPTDPNTANGRWNGSPGCRWPRRRPSRWCMSWISGRFARPLCCSRR